MTIRHQKDSKSITNCGHIRKVVSMSAIHKELQIGLRTQPLLLFVAVSGPHTRPKPPNNHLALTHNVSG